MRVCERRERLRNSDRKERRREEEEERGGEGIYGRERVCLLGRLDKRKERGWWVVVVWQGNNDPAP
jgi:hypothetical protein